MSPKATALRAAATALAHGKHEDALANLLVAWRAVRHPRVADVIDFVSSDLTAVLPPIKGKTVAARTAAWHAIEAKRDPATLGQLLATPWPGTWQAALPLLEALVTWPDDPRMAMAFAKILDATPYDTWTSKKFYRPLFVKLDQIADVRTLPILRAQLGKQKEYYYARDMRPKEERSVARLQELYPGGAPSALDDDAAAILDELESHFGARLAAAREAANGEAEYLAAIYAAPDDLALRAVYADWLGERGDPRGEFITLQLASAAGPPSDRAIARARQLLAKHGATWAGAIGSFFHEDGRVFENGFFAGGPLKSTPDSATPSDPAWSLVRELELHDDRHVELLDQPALHRVERVKGIGRDAAQELAAGARRALTVLHWSDWHSAQRMSVKSPLYACAALPGLLEIGITTRDTEMFATFLRDAPVVDRIARLALVETAVSTTMLEAAATRAGALREIELATGKTRENVRGWRVVIQRDRAPGPFTRFVARPRGPHDVMELIEPLAELPTGWLREVDVVTTKKFVLRQAEKSKLATVLKKLGALERHDAPWIELLGTKDEKKSKAPTGEALVLRVDGDGLLDAARVEKLWKLVVGELGQVYDSFEAGYNTKWRPLGKDPLATVKKSACNLRMRRLELLRDGHPGKLVIHRSTGGSEPTMLELRLGDLTHDAFVAWFLKFVELGKFHDGYVAANDAGDAIRDAFDLGDFGRGLHGGWLLFIGAPQRDLLPTTAVQALASRLRALIVYETKHGLVFRVAPTPAAVTVKQLTTLASGLVEIMTAQLPAFLGYDLLTRSKAVLGPLAKALGLALDDKKTTPTRVVFSKRGKRERRLVVDLINFMADASVEVELHHEIGADPGWQTFQLTDGYESVKTAAGLEKLLASAVDIAASRNAETFFDDAAAKKKPKRR